MKLAGIFVVLCLVGCGLAQAPRLQQPSPFRITVPDEASDARSKRSYDKWLELITEYVKQSGGDGAANNPWKPFPISYPIPSGDGAGGINPVPILVLPIPVPVPGLGGNGDCSANKNPVLPNQGFPNQGSSNSADRGFPPQIGGRGDNYPNYQQPSRNPYDDYEEPAPQGFVSTDYLIKLFREQQPNNPELPPAVVEWAPVIEYPSVQRYARSSNKRPSSQNYQGTSPFQFQPSAGYKAEKEYLPPSGFPDTNGQSPPPLQFNKSWKVKGFLTVHDSDYTEAYEAWYDASTGASRVELHNKGTISYRMMLPDGKFQWAMTYTDRTPRNSKDVRVCGMTSPTTPAAEDRTPVIMPNVEDFHFVGTREEFGGVVEVWEMTVTGRSGELGAVRGETLVYHHELLCYRQDSNDVKPLKYTVEIDSSLLGPKFDKYVHIYSDVQDLDNDRSMFQFNPETECDRREQMTIEDRTQFAQLNPLREYMMPYRDPRYDQDFKNFTTQYQRSYTDEKETAMRKALIIQKQRFVESCNRQGEEFTLTINFLSDRLDAELETLFGATYSEGAEKDSLQFPYSENELGGFRSELPKRFDWRRQGGVTPVKYQGYGNDGNCMSCWAFAVVGSVEGALFAKTGNLQDLSEQTLVDCGHSHGCNGCNGTWPTFAFSYVKDRGICSTADYAPYMARKMKCKSPPVPPVTRISDHFRVTPNNIDALKVAIKYNAPTVVVVDSRCKTFQAAPKSGVLTDRRCITGPYKRLNHAVLAVGWGERKNGKRFFIIKNSWSDRWGNKGYINLDAETNTAGVLTIPAYPVLKRKDIAQLPPNARPFNKDFEEDNWH